MITAAVLLYFCAGMWVDRRCGSGSNGSLGDRIQRKKVTVSLSQRGGFTSSKGAAERDRTGSALLYSLTEVSKLTRKTPTRALVVLQSKRLRAAVTFVVCAHFRRSESCRRTTTKER